MRKPKGLKDICRDAILRVSFCFILGYQFKPMRGLLSFGLMVLLPVLVCGQSKPHVSRAYGRSSNKDEECANKADQCLNSHKYNAKQRRAFYPFNIAKTIRLVSYESMRDPKPIIIDTTPGVDSDPGELFTGVKPGEFVVDYSQIKEFKDLSKKQTDLLTDIFFNVGFTPIKCNIYNADPGYSCYEPRNAIIFIDKNGKVFQYVEFCFACRRYYLSSTKIKNTTYCHQKFDMLSAFFVSQGIEYGSNKVR